MYFLRAVRPAVAAGVALAMTGAAFAQSTTIDFVNSELDPIPLLDGSAVTIDGNGNIQANCVLDGTTCQGITGGAGAPVVTFTTAAGGNAATITTGSSLGVTWSSTNSPDVCLARASEGVGSWSGTKGAIGTQTLSFSSVGTFDLSLECYNDNGSHTSDMVTVTVEQGQGPITGPDSCDIASTDPNFQNPGFVRHNLTWAAAFYDQTFPDISNGGLSPVGSFTFGNPGLAITGQYLSIEFTPPAGGAHRLDWNRSQRVDSRGYLTNRPADAVYVTISPCAGDFRTPNYSVPNTNPHSDDCRAYGPDGQLFFGAASNQCRLEANRKYYVNIVFGNPFGPLSPTTNTCANGAAYCNANFGN